jgi:hypothetical protein
VATPIMNTTGESANFSFEKQTLLVAYKRGL